MTTPPRSFADTNVFIALLLGPEHSLHAQALDLFRRVAFRDLDLVLSPVVVAELVHYLRKTAGWSRAEIGEQLSALLAADGMEARTVERSLDLYAETARLDYPDAWLAAAALEAGDGAVASFDKDFDRIPGVRRIAA